MLILAIILTLIYAHALYNWDDMPILYQLLAVVLQLTAFALVTPTFTSLLERPNSLASIGLAIIYSMICISTILCLILSLTSLVFYMVVLCLYTSTWVDEVVKPALKRRNKDVVTFINRIFDR